MSLAAACSGEQNYHRAKKIRDISEKLKSLPHLDESERLLMARSLAATPDERWLMSQAFLRSLGLSKLSERKKFGFKSPA